MLHLSLLPLSGIIHKMFDTELPIPAMIGTMLFLSLGGLLSEVAFYSHLKEKAASPSQKSPQL